MADAPEWMSCESREPFVSNSLKAAIKDLRTRSTRCRRAFTKPWMGEPAEYLAVAYDELATILEAKLADIGRAKATGSQGGGHEQG